MNAAAIQHWEGIYRNKPEAQTSWFRPHLDTSLRLIEALHLQTRASVIDVGGGRSTLVDDLLARGFSDLTVLDIAAAALDKAQARLAGNAARVNWIVADVLEAPFATARFSLWHDRAVFHFLIDAEAQRRYVERAAAAVAPGGHAIVATFAPDGPERCSNLPVQRYDADTLAARFAPHFALLDSAREQHLTPWSSTQAFTYIVLRRSK